jgi:hypothetical protein
MVSDESKRAEHTRLVLTMADRQGFDLQEMIIRAEFTEDQLELAVDRCVGCTRSHTCKSLLATSEPVLKLPDYCRNGDAFDALKSL